MTMTTIRVSILGAVLTISAAPAFAQSTAPLPHIGIGVGLTNGTGGLTPAFEVPIDITSHLRVQPEFSYQRETQSESESTILAGSPVSLSTSQTNSTTWLGTAVLYTVRQDRLGWYVGGKFGLVRTALDEHESAYLTTPAVNQSTSANGYFVGPVFGGQFFLHDRFSLGATIAFIYASTEYTLPAGIASPLVTVNSTASETRFETQASVVARIYLR